MIEFEPAVLRGLVEAEQIELAHALQHLVGGVDLRRLPFINEGVDLVFDKTSDGALQFLVLGREQH